MFRNALTRTLFAFSIFVSAGHAAHAGSQFSLGVEGFGDRYQEPSRKVDVTVDSAYGSVTAGYVYTSSADWFVGVDARGSYGRDSYKSPSGTVSGVSQYEGDARLKLGPAIHGMNGTLYPYVGFGWRTFLDKGAGTQTSLGLYGYNRYINQAYIPIGAWYNYHSDESGWNYTPMLEFDALVYGHVKSQLGPILGFDVVNRQRNGYGVRSEFMFGHSLGSHEIEFGPFVRYWTVQDSDPKIDPRNNNRYFYEPHNTRLQAGVAMRLKL